MVLSGDGWTRESVFECKRCHQGIRQSGGSCVLILVSFWLDLAQRGYRGSLSCLCFSSWDETARLICGGGAIPLNKYRSSTLVGLRYPEMALQATFRTGSFFEACDDLLQTRDAYSADEKHRSRAVVRIVLPSVPQLVFANFLRMLFLARLCLGISNVVSVREASV